MSGFSDWLNGAETTVENWFTNEEAILAKYFGPLFSQILAQAETIGKGDVVAGLQVLTDAATTAVAAGATAEATGGNAVTAAETSFVATTTSEGITAIHNAEAGLIKAGVAIAQSAVTAVVSAVTDSTTVATDPAAPVEPTPETLPAA